MGRGFESLRSHYRKPRFFQRKFLRNRGFFVLGLWKLLWNYGDTRIDYGDTHKRICLLFVYLTACVISSEQERFWGANLAIELSQSPKSTEIYFSRAAEAFEDSHLDVSLIDGYFDLRR